MDPMVWVIILGTTKIVHSSLEECEKDRMTIERSQRKAHEPPYHLECELVPMSEVKKNNRMRAGRRV